MLYFLLGYSKSAKSVAHLIQVLTNQKDFFDHDFAYEACHRLGELAHEELSKFALQGNEEERYSAVQALGHSSGNSIPWLRKVLQSGNVPQHFLGAYMGQWRENPVIIEGLPDLVEAGLWSADPEQLDEALCAAQSLLEETQNNREFIDLINLTKWKDRLIELATDEEIEEELAAGALECLGYLRDERHIDFIVKQIDQSEEGMGKAAVEALGLYHTDTARTYLVGLLSHKNLEISSLAAAKLLND